MVCAHSCTNKEIQLFPSAKTRGVLHFRADGAHHAWKWCCSLRIRRIWDKGIQMLPPLAFNFLLGGSARKRPPRKSSKIPCHHQFQTQSPSALEGVCFGHGETEGKLRQAGVEPRAPIPTWGIPVSRAGSRGRGDFRGVFGMINKRPLLLVLLREGSAASGALKPRLNFALAGAGGGNRAANQELLSSPPSARQGNARAGEEEGAGCSRSRDREQGCPAVPSLSPHRQFLGCRAALCTLSRTPLDSASLVRLL